MVKLLANSSDLIISFHFVVLSLVVVPINPNLLNQPHFI